MENEQTPQNLEEQKKYFWSYLKNIVILKRDIDTKLIKENIYESMNFQGHIVWILVCSIIIASIGLNVSSTAVVIGAMLISPLMSPIVAIGLAVGTYNWPKLKSALKNFAVMIVVSLITSYVYFLLSPLKAASSELLARTEPTLLDVFIALAGGAAGIIAISRKEISNVIPGVAIATALMPPLCTAGYGLATFQMKFFWGAFYLFILNSIMIALVTYLIVNYLRFPNYKYVNEARAKRLRTYVTLFTMAVMVPSIFVFYGLVKKSSFTREAEKFISEVETVHDNRLMQKSIVYDSDSSTIKLIYVQLDEGDQETIRSRYKKHKFSKTKLQILQVGKSANDLATERLTQKEKDQRLLVLSETTEKQSKTIKKQNDSLLKLSAELDRYAHFKIPIAQIEQEVKTVFPEVQSLSIANVIDDSEDKLEDVPVLLVKWHKKAHKATEQKLEQLITKRLRVKKVILLSL